MSKIISWVKLYFISEILSLSRLLIYLRRVKVKLIMAKPIKDTPLLTGDDATRFEQAAQEVVPASQKEINEAKQAYSFFASIATFAL